MTSNDRTEPGQAPRKTLEEIRRDLDAEYGALPEIEAPARLVDRLVPPPYLDEDEDDAELERDELDGPGRPARRRGYVIAGVIGCIAGQLLLAVGYLTITGYWTVLRARDVGSGLLRVTDAAIPSPPTPSETPSPTAAPTPPPKPADIETASDSPAPIMPAAPPAATSAPPAYSPGRLVHQPPPTSPTPPPRPRGSRFDDWAESQAQLRAALSGWLAMSGRGDDIYLPDVVVILNADGRTAKTHVPTRWGGGVVIREQRWERGADGWRIVAENHHK